MHPFVNFVLANWIMINCSFQMRKPLLLHFPLFEKFTDFFPGDDDE